MGLESFGVVGFDLQLLLQGQTRIAKSKSAHNSLNIGPRGLQCETNLYEIMGGESFDIVRFDLGPLLQGQTRIAKLKSAHNSLIIYHTGLGWQTNLQEIMGQQSFYVGRFDLGPLLQGQTRIPKLKSAYISKHFAYLVSVQVLPQHLCPLPTGVYLCQPKYSVCHASTMSRPGIHCVETQSLVLLR